MEGAWCVCSCESVRSLTFLESNEVVTVTNGSEVKHSVVGIKEGSPERMCEILIQASVIWASSLIKLHPAHIWKLFVQISQLGSSGIGI